MQVAPRDSLLQKTSMKNIVCCYWPPPGQRQMLLQYIYIYSIAALLELGRSLLSLINPTFQFSLQYQYYSLINVQFFFSDTDMRTITEPEPTKFFFQLMGNIGYV